MASPLISTSELADRIGDPGLRILDASWHLDGRDARPDFIDSHIPGAVFVDLEAISDPTSGLPHTLPSPASFAASMGVLGVSDQNSIVVYDTLGLVTAPRVWWMLRVMGARDMHVLDGGLPKWRAEERPLEHGLSSKPDFAVFNPAPDLSQVADVSAVVAALTAGDQVLDARSAARFRGEAAEPRAGLRSGHMPGALNLPYPGLMSADGTLKREQALRDAFIDAGVDLGRPTITTCGSGVTAAILSLGLAELGYASRLYDGSWSEWGARADLPVATG